MSNPQKQDSQMRYSDKHTPTYLTVSSSDYSKTEMVRELIKRELRVRSFSESSLYPPIRSKEIPDGFPELAFGSVKSRIHHFLPQEFPKSLYEIQVWRIWWQE